MTEIFNFDIFKSSDGRQATAYPLHKSFAWLICTFSRLITLFEHIYNLDHPSSRSGEVVEGPSNDVAAAHDSISHKDPEIKQESEDELEETQVGEIEDDTKSISKENFKDQDDEYDSDDEHHLCSVLLYFISKTLLNHLRDEPEDTPMDRFAEQFFGRQDQSSRSRPPEDPSFMETFAKNLAKSAAKSAARRAMGQSSSEKRTRDGTRSGNQINPEDFRGVAEFVLGMLGGKNEQPRRDDDRKKDKKRKRDKDKVRSREAPRSRDVEDDGDKYGSDKERRKRRRHRVTFAEPYYESPRPEETYYAQPYEPRRDGDKEERRRRRRQRRYKRDLDLKTLKTELEAMSSTIISLNARGAKHRDCEFYDRFGFSPYYPSAGLSGGGGGASSAGAALLSECLEPPLLIDLCLL
ncbi:uncharacterized protein BKA55DRAFT_739673 [Fusarium redolens]|uniref:Uncharacterized protein n=1 Tax=Fusarium redolens TaxID=48865 RepID=A0A9P9K8Q8_FUSRE|nr:uncharacterized protein BKA55DRAFT_739673 [Fusarium redolens]KAH7244079.1 hypothetical protein BKA55DRAFT_739673 [Fusarium redolens]